MVTSSKKKWQEVNEYSDEQVKRLAEELDKSDLFIKICLQRGLDSAEKIQHFTNIDEKWFHDPYLMHDMEKIVERIVSALENGEKITVYGDYDADGMTSTALLTETLDSLGADVNYYLPNRFTDGYGPNVAAFQKIIEEGTSLVITVDNGVAGHEAINFASNQGIDVIITDHHELPENLPEAYAILHPKHPEGNYPFGDLAGVGVALKLASALIGDVPIELLELAAIGTVADLVSLTDENRAIVHFGLLMLQQTQRTGIYQLLKVIGKDLNEIDEDTIGFQIAPRLNAVGRLGDASPCVEMLTTLDPDRASELATFINDKNEERKAIVDEMASSALDQLMQKEGNYEVNVLADDSWHQGVLGIVASRVVEKTNKPTLLFTIDKNTGVAKGSARSIEDVNLYKAFSEISHLFLQFGGHHMAAGMSADVAQLSQIEKELSNLVAALNIQESIQPVDAFIDLEQLTVDSIKELNQLKPFGTDNLKPFIAVSDVEVVQKRKVGADQNHLKLSVQDGENVLDIISFQNGKISDVLYENQRIGVAGHVEINEWNGFTKPQMQMTDVDIPGPILVDQRTNTLTKEQFGIENVDYIFYNKNSFARYQSYVPKTSTAQFIENTEDAKSFISSQRQMIIVDCPNSIEQFLLTIQENEELKIVCYFYKVEHFFLSGLPTREEFAKAYKYFITHQNINLQKEGHLLVQQLKMESEKVFLIVKVFLEAKFVIINDGLLNSIKNPKKVSLENTVSYKLAKRELLAEELFIYSSFYEVIQSINGL